MTAANMKNAAMHGNTNAIQKYFCSRHSTAVSNLKTDTSCVLHQADTACSIYQQLLAGLATAAQV